MDVIFYLVLQNGFLTLHTVQCIIGSVCGQFYIAVDFIVWPYIHSTTCAYSLLCIWSCRLLLYMCILNRVSQIKGTLQSESIWELYQRVVYLQLLVHKKQELLSILYLKTCVCILFVFNLSWRFVERWNKVWYFYMQSVLILDRGLLIEIREKRKIRNNCRSCWHGYKCSVKHQASVPLSSE